MSISPKRAGCSLLLLLILRNRSSYLNVKITTTRISSCLPPPSDLLFPKMGKRPSGLTMANKEGNLRVRQLL